MSGKSRLIAKEVRWTLPTPLCRSVPYCCSQWPSAHFLPCSSGGPAKSPSRWAQRNEPMHATLDIPDSLYRRLKRRATNEGCSIRELVLCGAENVVYFSASKKQKGVSLPLIRSKRPGSLKIDNAKIYELIFPVSDAIGEDPGHPSSPKKRGSSLRRLRSE